MTTDKQYYLIKNDIVFLEAINNKINKWLTNNRAGYNSEKWAILIENHSNTQDFAIPLPPEYNEILTNEESIGLFEGKLPSKWFAIVEI